MGDIRKHRDRLSELPDGFLHSILSRLHIDNSVRTAALSRRWRHVWCTNPSLFFTVLTFFAVDPRPTFKSLTRVFLSAPPLRASLPSHSRSTLATLTSTPSLAVGSPSPPPDVFSCQTLRSLKLRHCVISPLPNNPGTPHFSFLESLQFVCVALNKKTLIELTSSPRLKYLCLDHVRCADLLEILSPTLEVLDIRFQSPASIFDVPIQEVTFLWNPKVARSQGRRQNFE